MAKRPALGKGIGALIHGAAQEGGKKYFLCPIEEMRPLTNQPRKTFVEEKLKELAASIREKGIIQPLVVRQVADYYQIIAGERRWRAAQLAGIDKIPVVIQDVSDRDALEMALIENVQREDLNPIEEAEAYTHLVQKFDLTQEEVAKRVGKERSTVANALRLLRLPSQVKDMLTQGELAMGHARALLSLPDEADMREAARLVVDKGMSVRETEKLIQKVKNFDRKKSPSKKDTNDPDIEHLSELLTRQLGAKTRVFPRKQGGGRLEVSYQDLNDLDRILDLLGLGNGF